MAKYNPEVSLLEPSTDAAVSAISVTTLDSIAVTVLPTKTVYTVGETLDISGIVVTAVYSDESQAVVPVTAADITGFDSSEPAINQTITVTYEGVTTTFNVTIITEDGQSDSDMQ